MLLHIGARCCDSDVLLQRRVAAKSPLRAGFWLRSLAERQVRARGCDGNGSAWACLLAITELAKQQGALASWLCFMHGHQDREHGSQARVPRTLSRFSPARGEGERGAALTRAHAMSIAYPKDGQACDEGGQGQHFA
jgi:hypothetical protein